MARTVRTPQVLSSVGVVETFSNGDNVNGETVAYNGRRALHCKNVTAGPITVTLNCPVTVDGQAAPNRVVSVPATTGDLMIGMESGVYLQTDGTVWINYSATGLSVSSIEI